jgi:transcriptional accessory protein Tex/SPT6
LLTVYYWLLYSLIVDLEGHRAWGMEHGEKERIVELKINELEN